MVHAIRLGLAVGLLVLMWLSRRITGTWANPVAFYAGAFTLVALGQELMLPNLPFGEPMAGLILGSTIALLLGVAITTRRPAEIVDPGPLPDNRRTARTALLLLAYGVVVFYLLKTVEARATGLGMENNGFFDRAQFFAEGGQTLLLRALQALTYCGVLYVAFESRQRKRPILLVVSYLAIVFTQSVIFGGKLAVLIDILLFVAVVCVGYPSRIRNINRRVVIGAVAGLLGVAVTFHVVTTIRQHGRTDSVATAAYAILSGASAYSLLLDGEVQVPVERPFGLSVAGIRDPLIGKGDNRRLGIYESIVFDPTHAAESTVNVYTWFVALDNDFGLLGSLGVIFAVGLASGRLISRQLVGGLGVLGQTTLVLINAQLMYSPIFVLTYYNFFLLLLFLGVPLSLLYANPRPPPGRLPSPMWAKPRSTAIG